MTDTSDAPLAQIRRSATLPSKLNPRSKRSVESLRPSENDLFYHPAAKVVHFAPRALAPIPSSTAPADFDYPVDTVETLPWRSPTERTVAFAPLRLEKVHGLTVFLKCGSVVHAILKNSQCWCVDGESTFVLRIRPLTYYRIELPNETEEDRKSVTAMKEALLQVLRYEVTPCPFKRGFTVEIPEEARVPRRKRAWRPKGRRESAPILSAYILDKSPAREDALTDSLSAGEDTDGNLTDDSCFTAKGSNSTVLETIPDDNEPSLPNNVPEITDLPRRSVSETQQSFQTLLARFEDTPEPPVKPEMPLSSSVDSFHSIASSPSSPTESNSGSPFPSVTSTDGTDLGLRETSNNQDHLENPKFEKVDFSAGCTVPEVKCEDCCSPRPRASPRASFSEEDFRRVPGALPDDQMSIASYAGTSKTTDSNPNLSSMSMEFRRRSKASRERELSPMPPQSALALTSPSDKENTASLIQKTCTVVLIPPIQLFIVLIHIAARIVLGPALTSAVGELNHKYEYQVADPEEAVDDFDLPLAPDCPRKQSVSEANSWELD
ncbi:inheritance of peroxisomes protein 1-domain-containing protein [Aspergillus pseudotamarii]|uniref:Inheritance of peroxisomes protein 1 n=1 Tax=Aspergillus pseudotamarii TaxID=132259 RepID=A0A5N6TCL3_ASPPS|nr:inheritance of peroxisomes protein 1-domain-containing protein [Aspergillus pseudotamarii]KAE8144010.1 inheritance of peroxisomes protein 1-domain-containing protein [Aspergillus pseudotamarii]